MTEEVSLYFQAVIGKGGEDGGFKSTSESDFRGVGGEKVGRTPKKLNSIPVFII